MVARFRIAPLLPLAAVLVALTGCTDRELPTDVGSRGALFTQSAAAPVVNSLGDEADMVGCDDTDCTLREALAFATAGATITFAAELTGAVTLTLGTLSIIKDVTISGPGATSLAVSGGFNEGVFNFEDTVTATISGLTLRDAGSYPAIQNGGTLTLSECVVSGNHMPAAANWPGGINNWGNLTITGSTISDNSTERTYGGGGGIHNNGTLTIDASTISGNTAALTGGGIYNESSGDGTTYPGVMTLTNSIVSGNSAMDGGGIYNLDAPMTVVGTTISGNSATAEGGGIYSSVEWENPQNYTEILNSTVSNNTAAGDGGGIYNYNGLTRIVLSTVTGNQAAAGAGVWSYNDGVTRTDVKGSLIWGNTVQAAAPTIAARSEVMPRGRTKAMPTIASLAVAGTPEDVFAYKTDNRYNSLGYNLIGAAGGSVDFTLEFNATGDQTDVGDALLGSLADNGGPTLTHALLFGSPAIDAGTCTDHDGATVSIDQRGFIRPQGSACDIGAYESSYTGLPDPDFTFATLPDKTYGDGSFSVAGYASSSNSGGAISFSLGSGSVGCSVTAAGLVTLIGAATGADYCVVRAVLAPSGTFSSATRSQSFNIARAALTVTADDETITYGSTPAFSVQYSGFVATDDSTSLGGALAYTFEGITPTSYGPLAAAPANAGTYSITPSGYSSDDYAITYGAGTFTINKAAGAVTINNLPTHAQLGGSFTPTYTKLGDGVASTTSNTPGVCTVDESSGVVSFVAEGTCTLVASVTEGTNYLAVLSGNSQNFGVGPALISSCTYTVNPKNGSRAVTVTWANANPGVTKIQLVAGRVVTKQMAPTASGSWSTSVKQDPTYGLWGGAARKDAGTVLVPAGTACTP